MSSVAFHLLIGGNCAKDNFSEVTTVEWTVRDAATADLEVAHNKGGGSTHPTTSSGFFTMAIERWVRSYTSRAM